MSSGGGEEGCYWCDWGLGGCRVESSNSGFLTSISPVCGAEGAGCGEGKAGVRESRPVPERSGLNPSPAGRTETGRDLVGWPGVTRTRPPLSPPERHYLPSVGMRDGATTRKTPVPDWM